MRIAALALPLLAVAAPLAAQSAAKEPPSIIGTWRVDPKKLQKEGPREVIIREDSSASWGKETVRWRLKGDSISIALGGEWETYRLKVKPKAITLSGGDLKESITLDRIGPPTPRPNGVAVPPDPDKM